MKLVIIRHGETEWSLSGRYTGTTDVPLTSNGHRQAASLASLVERMLSGRSAPVFSSPRRRATATAALAFPGRHITVDPLVAEYHYGDYEGLTGNQIRLLAPGWDIWRDGCPHGETTESVGVRADSFLETNLAHSTEPVVVVTHGHFSRILAARALGLAAETGRLFASLTASISVIGDYHGERCIERWNVDAALLDGSGNRTASGENVASTETPRVGRP
ncbi:histidine phosphatase family protein [Nocardia sp. NPDC051570]|uniref:histidine phosphatase family protein n=1 Tax=Nocardia sp. NPDC051570 TaxID=3364324 RepID=UPI0037937AD3